MRTLFPENTIAFKEWDGDWNFSEIIQKRFGIDIWSCFPKPHPPGTHHQERLARIREVIEHFGLANTILFAPETWQQVFERTYSEPLKPPQEKAA